MIRVISTKYQLEKGTSNSAGYDLKCCESGNIEPNCRKSISTGIRLEIPKNYYGRVAPRSGLALRNGINVLAGVIDSDYRGEIFVILHNTDDKPFLYERGDKIAQIIFEKCYDFEFKYVEKFDKITERGEMGFGSTGK